MKTSATISLEKACDRCHEDTFDFVDVEPQDIVIWVENAKNGGLNLEGGKYVCPNCWAAWRKHKEKAIEQAWLMFFGPDIQKEEFHIIIGDSKVSQKITMPEPVEVTK